MSTLDSPAVYQLRIRLDRISPMIWRRLLVTTDTTIAELHAIIQIAFGWSDSQLQKWSPSCVATEASLTPRWDNRWSLVSDRYCVSGHVAGPLG